jgi:hypothetical protein
LYSLDRFNPALGANITAEIGTARITSNATGIPSNLIECKPRRQNKDVRCSFEQPADSKPYSWSRAVDFTSEHARWSLDQLQVKNLNTKGTLSGRNDTFAFAMSIHLPNSSFVVPGTVSSERQESLPRLEADGICSGHWERNGTAGRDRLFRTLGFGLKTSCTNKLFIQATYSRPIQGTPLVQISIISKLHIGVGGMHTGWEINFYAAERISENGTQDMHCKGDICTWETFKPEFRSVYFVHYID